MILPESYEEIAAYIDSTKKVVFFFYSRLVSRLSIYISSNAIN